MTTVAERAGQLLETKTIRRVRTEAGVRRYKQPIGSIIINDSLLVGLTVTGDSKVSGAVLIDGADGKKYSIQKTRLTTSGRTVYRAYERGGEQREIYEGNDETEAYATLAQHVQREAGMDMSSGRLPGSSGKREGWSKNQVEGANDSIYSWGNTATDNGNDALAYAMWNIGGELDQHGDIRKARHDLEQLKKRDDLDLDRDLGGENGREIIDYAIVGVVTEGKLKKRYDEAEEAEYAAGAADRATERANTPQPVKTSEIQIGQWVRKVDKDGNPASDWLKITDTGEQSHIAGRSRLLDYVDRNGKKGRYYRQSPRDKWETIADPKDQPSYEEVKQPPTNVVKRVDRLQEGDYTTIGGKTGYVGKYGPDKTNETVTVDGKKRNVYAIAMYGDRKFTEPLGVVKVPAGTMSGAEVADNKPTDLGEVQDTTPVAPETPSAGGYKGFPALTKVESDFDGYDKLEGSNGSVFYLKKGRGGKWSLYDDKDNQYTKEAPEEVALSYAQKMGSGDYFGMSEATRNFRTATSEYDGYGKFVGADGNNYYADLGSSDSGVIAIYDSEDNVVGTVNARTGDMAEVMNRIADPNKASVATPSYPNLRKEQSEYAGFDKYTSHSGTAYYGRQTRDGYEVVDADDNNIGTWDLPETAWNELGGGLTDSPLAAARQDSDRTVTRSQRSLLKPYANLKPVDSEYADFDKIVGANGNQYYIPKRADIVIAYDENDVEVTRGPTLQDVYFKLDGMSGTSDVIDDRPEAPVGTVTPLKRLKSKYDGWKRFRLSDNRVVDTGQATADDGRWYATGPGGWDEILADGDTEEDMMAKLRALNAIDQPITFSPSNTDVTPKRETGKRGKTNVPLSDGTQTASPIAGMSQEDYEAAKKRTSDATRRAVMGMNAPSRGRGKAGPKRDYNAPADGVLPQDPETQRQQDEAERRLGRTNVGSQLDDLRSAREGIAADRRAREQDAAPVRTNDQVMDDLAQNIPSNVSAGITARNVQRDLQKGGSVTDALSSLRFAAREADTRNSELLRRAADELQRNNPALPPTAPVAAVQPAAAPAYQTPRSLPLLRDLEMNPWGATRNGKKLTANESRLLNLDGSQQEHQQFRMNRPATASLNNRMNAFQDDSAKQAITDKATFNFLNGQTPSAAWRSAIEEAEAVADRNSSTYAVRSTYGRGYQIVRTDPDGSVHELRTGNSRADLGRRAANDQQRSRDRAVAAMNGTGGTPGRSNAPVASTAGARVASGQSPEARSAEIQSNIRRAHDDVLRQRGRRPGDAVRLTDIRRALDAQGYSREEQDRALIDFERSVPGASVFAEMNQKTLTDQDRRDAVSIGNRDAHFISINPNQGRTNPNSVDVTFNPMLDTRRVEEVALTINEAEARQLARVYPARFLRVMATRDLKQGRDRDDFRDADYLKNYLELMQYADDLDGAEAGRVDFNVNDVFLNARNRFTNTPGADRIKEAIINVLEQEQNR